MSASSSLLDTRAAAEYLCLSPRTLEKWRSTGVGPAYCRIGGGVRYRVADLDAFVAARTVGGAA